MDGDLIVDSLAGRQTGLDAVSSSSSSSYIGLGFASVLWFTRKCPTPSPVVVAFLSPAISNFVAIVDRAGLGTQNQQKRRIMVKRRRSDGLSEGGCLFLQRDLNDYCQRHTCNLWLFGEYALGSFTKKRLPVVKDLVCNKNIWLVVLKAYLRVKMIDRDFVTAMRNVVAEDPSLETDAALISKCSCPG